MDRGKNLVDETEYNGTDLGTPLEDILVDMLRSALAWEQQHGIPDAVASSSLPSSTPSPLNNIPKSDETEDENLRNE